MGRMLPVIDVRHGKIGQNRTNLFHRKIKMIKRQMYGRVGFALLRQRVDPSPLRNSDQKNRERPRE